jgi:hypothetical protein
LAETVDGTTIIGYDVSQSLNAIGDTGSLPVIPDSLAFASGQWDGDVTVNGISDNVVLLVDDGAGHSGDSNPFSMLPQQSLDSDGDGIPDWWENLYFGGPINAVTNAMCANGINTVLQAYIAGFDPTDTDARFELSGYWNELWWDSVSGRVYGVHWTTNLLDGFQPLETNILWSAGGFTDTVHGAATEGFYSLKVNLE